MLLRTLRISLYDHVCNKTIRQQFGVAPIHERCVGADFVGYGHVVRATADAVINASYTTLMLMEEDHVYDQKCGDWTLPT